MEPLQLLSAHTRNEDNARDILKQIASSNLDLIFGELEDLGEDDVPEKEETIEILSKRFQLLDKSLELTDDIILPNPLPLFLMKMKFRI